MRIDQPDPIDAGDPGASGVPGAPGEPGVPRAAVTSGVPRVAGAERQGATEAAARRAPGHETETAAERTSRRETEAAPEGTAQREAKSPVSRADQIAAHLQYRETVSVTVRAADGRAAWAQALPELRAAWEEHKERYPDRARAAPRTEPDGSWSCGEHRRLDPEQNTEATKAHADLADEAGRHILPALRRIEAADPDRQLAGLEHMVKGEDRLKEKLADELAGNEQDGQGSAKRSPRRSPIHAPLRVQALR